MKSFVRLIICFVVFACFSVFGLQAQTEGLATQNWFKPRYAGTSLNTGFMFTPNVGSGFFVAPKVSFQTTPRLFINAGVGVVQYSLLPSVMPTNFVDGGASRQRAVTSAYVFTEGVYFLNERWSVNGSMMKNTTPEPMRKVAPFRMPNEAAHLGLDFRVTPNVTIGARVGYTSN